MWRRVSSRFGMSAPRVTVRAHIPWHWRALVTTLMLAVALVLAGWVYDIGRRFAGYDKTVAEQELHILHSRVEVLEAEAESLRSAGSGSEASLQIDRTVQQKLSEQVKRLEVENSRLREELAVFESLFSSDIKSESIRISRMQVEPDSAGAGGYHYSFLLTAPAARLDQTFKGRLQLVAIFQKNGKAVSMNALDTSRPDARNSLVDFKYFHRVEGGFTLPPGAVLNRFEARLQSDRQQHDGHFSGKRAQQRGVLFVLSLAQSCQPELDRPCASE